MLNKDNTLQVVLNTLKINEKTKYEAVAEVSNNEVNWCIFTDKFDDNLNPQMLLNLSATTNEQLEALITIDIGNLITSKLKIFYFRWQKDPEEVLSNTISRKFEDEFEKFYSLFFKDEEITKDILIAFLVYNFLKGESNVRL